MTENRCVQLAAIERDGAGKALVADVKAKNLDVSAVDLLLIVKVRGRRCVPLSVLGCRSIPQSGTLVRRDCSQTLPQLHEDYSRCYMGTRLAPCHICNAAGTATC